MRQSVSGLNEIQNIFLPWRVNFWRDYRNFPLSNFRVTLFLFVFFVIYQLFKPIRSDFGELASFGFPLLSVTKGRPCPKHEAE